MEKDAPFTQPNNGHLIFAALRDVLADLYPEESNAHVVVADAGLDAKQIPFSARAQTNWHHILTEAVHQSRLDELLSIALSTYGNNSRLKGAYFQYTQFILQGGDITPPGRPDVANLVLKVENESPAPGEPPYKGLSFFEVKDAHLYFGRQRLMNELVSLLTEANKGNSRFLAVIGASGSGKSSLVRAGLVPALVNGAIKGSDRWLIKIVTPAAHPLRELAAALTESESDRVTLQLMDDLAADDRVLDVRASKVLAGIGRTSERLLLIVDQFEELFTLCKDRAERRSYIDNLLTAAQADGPIIVVLTLRADFYRHCLDYERLCLHLERHTKLIGPMSRDQLREAIIAPAETNGWEFEAGLIDLFLDDVGDEPGALPLLSHALRETWERRRGHTLTLAGYSEVGRVQGAISTTADRIFTSLNNDQKIVAKNIFLRLTELGEGAEDTRRRVQLTELLPTGEDIQNVEQVLKILADARLITTHADEAEVAHEALIREWSQLREWLDDDREGLRIHRRLTEATQEWVELGRDPDTLFRGVRLETTYEWTKQNEKILNTLEREFLLASQLAADAEIKAKEDARKREVEQARALAKEAQAREQEQTRSRLRLRRYLIGLAVMFILALGASGYVLYQSQLLREQTNELAKRSRRALSGQLAAQSQFVRTNNEDPSGSLALLLAMQAVSTTLRSDGYVLNEADAALRQAIDSASTWRTNLPVSEFRYGKFKLAEISPTRNKVIYLIDRGNYPGEAIIWDLKAENYRYEEVELKRQNNKVFSANFSPDGQTIITTRNEGSAGLWDVTTGQKIGNLDGPPQRLDFATFSPNGEFVAIAQHNGVRLVDSVTGKEKHNFQWATKNSWSSGFAQFGPNGHTIVTPSEDGVRIWDVSTGRSIHNFKLPTNWIRVATFNPDGSLLLILGDGGVYFWNVTTAQQIFPLKKEDAQKALAAAFSPEGQFIATAEDNGIVHLWDIKTGKESRRFEDHFRYSKLLLFSPNGHILLTSNGNDRIHLWDTKSGRLRHSVYTSPFHTQNVVFRPDGNQFVVIGYHGVYLWDTNEAKELKRYKGYWGDVYSAEFSPDGKMLVTTSADGSVRVLDVETGEVVRRLDDLRAYVNAAIFDPSGQIIATARSDAAIALWKADSLEQILLLHGHHGPVNSVEFSPDGKTLVTAGFDDTARLWIRATGKQVLIFHGHTQPVRSASFSPDGQMVVTASDDSTARLWNTKTGKQLHLLSGHVNTVRTAKFDSTGRYVVTASFDGTARTWDTHTGQEILLIREPYGNAILSASFVPNGKQIIITSYRKICFWEVSAGSLQGCSDIHTNWVNSATYSKDAQSLVTTSDDGSARIWNAYANKMLHRIEGRNDFFLTAKFSPDGKTVVTGSMDGNAGLWDAKTGKNIHLFQGHNAAITNVEFSSDNRNILTVSEDHTLRIWNIELDKQTLILRKSDAEILSANFSEDRKYIVTTSYQTACVLQKETGISIFCVKGHTDLVVSARLRLDGQLVTASYDGSVRLWQMGNGKEIRRWDNLVKRDDIVSFSYDGRLLIVARDKVAHIWNLDEAIEIRKLVGHIQPISSVSVSRDSSMLVTTGDDRFIRLWSNVAQNTNIRLLNNHSNQLQGHGGGVLSIAFSSDSRTVATASDDSTIRLWDIRTGEQIEQLSDKGHASFVTFSPDGQTIAFAKSGDIELWDVANHTSKHLLVGHTYGIHTIAFSADSKKLVSTDIDSVRIWDVPTGKQIYLIDEHPNRVLSAAFNPDDQTVVTTYWSNTARIWDINTNQPIRDFVGHSGPVVTGVFSPDGKTILTASDDSTARTWDVATGRQLQVFTGHQAKVLSAIFTPDGQRVITVSDDHTARVWDTATGTQIRILEGHTAGVWSVAIDPKGELIITGGRDNIARVWIARIEDILDIANSLVRIQRDSPIFTKEEMERFGIE